MTSLTIVLLLLAFAAASLATASAHQRPAGHPQQYVMATLALLMLLVLIRALF